MPRINVARPKLLQFSQNIISHHCGKPLTKLQPRSRMDGSQSGSEDTGNAREGNYSTNGLPLNVVRAPKSTFLILIKSVDMCAPFSCIREERQSEVVAH